MRTKRDYKKDNKRRLADTRILPTWLVVGYVLICVVVMVFACWGVWYG